MRNSTLKRLNFFKPLLFVTLFLFSGHTVFSQFYSTHYIAPAPWQYFSNANEIVIATQSMSAVNVVLSKSDGTLVANLTTIKGTPAVYRFTGNPNSLNLNPLNTVINDAGLIISSGDGTTSINLRNVASDAGGIDDSKIKGNAALTSFGDAGVGFKYRIGYYRDGSLGNFGGFGDQRPIYTIMAINNGTSIKLNGAVITTLNAGESYLFKAPLGSLVESSNKTVMNTSAHIDTPSGCGDGAFNQIPPESVLGSEYFIERGKGNDTAEQTTVVATKPNTQLTIDTFSVSGALVNTSNVTLVNAGDFYTFINGVSNTNFSASRVFATNNVAVYSGTAQGCEVDISTIAPVSACGGSNFIETAKFRHYNTGTLPYFGYVLLQDPSATIYVNNVDLESIAGVSPRHQLGTTGWYIINFEDMQISSPNFISVSSTAKMTISIVQQGGGFSMAGFFSNFAAIPEAPSVNYITGGGCTFSSAALVTPAGFAPYQWFFNGAAIPGAILDNYTATKTGFYSVQSTLACGSLAQSQLVSVTLCTDLEVVKTVDVAAPCIGSNVVFTIQTTNLGPNNVTGLSVNDLLPSGYTYVNSTPSNGSYNSTTGIWGIGDLDISEIATLSVTAKVNASGVYKNTASIPAGSQSDSNPTNDTSDAETFPKADPTTSNAGLDQTGAATCGLTTVTLTGNTPTIGTGQWTVVSGTGGSFALDSDPTTTFTGTAGTAYTLRWTISNSPCAVSSDDVAVTFNQKTAVPTITPTAATCSADGTSTINNYDGTNSYAFSPTGPTTNAAGLVRGMTFGTSYTVISNNGSCTSGASVSFSDTAMLTTPTVPTIVSTAATCSAAGTTTISNYNGANTYTFTPAGPTTDAVGLVNGMAFGTLYTVAAYNGSCTSGVSASFSNSAMLVTPAIPTISATATTCLAAGRILINNYDGANIYTFTPSGPTTNGVGLINGIIFGTSYTVTSRNGSCTSGASVSFTDTAVICPKPSIALIKTAKLNDENKDGFAQAGETITYSFEVANTGDTPLTLITVTDPLPGVIMTGGPLSLAVGESDLVTFKGNYVILQSDVNKGSIANQATVSGTSPNGTKVEDKSDDLNVIDDHPTVSPISGCAIKVFNAVSLDGTGENDKFYIRGLECYPDNTVEIYNRWGVLVFERDYYNNDERAFRGISEGRVTVDGSQELPVGTYFYIFKYKDTNSNTFEKSGYLYLNRK